MELLKNLNFSSLGILFSQVVFFIIFVPFLQKVLKGKTTWSGKRIAILVAIILATSFIPLIRHENGNWYSVINYIFIGSVSFLIMLIGDALTFLFLLKKKRVYDVLSAITFCISFTALIFGFYYYIEGGIFLGLAGVGIALWLIVFFVIRVIALLQYLALIFQFDSAKKEIEATERLLTGRYNQYSIQTPFALFPSFFGILFFSGFAAFGLFLSMLFLTGEAGVQDTERTFGVVLFLVMTAYFLYVLLQLPIFKVRGNKIIFRKFYNLKAKEFSSEEVDKVVINRLSYTSGFGVENSIKNIDIKFKNGESISFGPSYFNNFDMEKLLFYLTTTFKTKIEDNINKIH